MDPFEKYRLFGYDSNTDCDRSFSRKNDPDYRRDFSVDLCLAESTSGEPVSSELAGCDAALQNQERQSGKDQGGVLQSWSNYPRKKEMVGVYFGDNESSQVWRHVLQELKHRSTKDILITCIDNLHRFAEVIEDDFHQTDLQISTQIPLL